jgi:hypothetical protein
MGRTLVQDSVTEFGVSVCDIETSTMGRPWRDGGVKGKKGAYFSVLFNCLDTFEDLTQIGH